MAQFPQRNYTIGLHTAGGHHPTMFNPHQYNNNNNNISNGVGGSSNNNNGNFVAQDPNFYPQSNPFFGQRLHPASDYNGHHQAAVVAVAADYNGHHQAAVVAVAADFGPREIQFLPNPILNSAGGDLSK